MQRAHCAAVALLAPALVVASCKGGGGGGASHESNSLAETPILQTLQLNVVTPVDTTFVTRDHFIASVEMQISGEPFAQAMGRDLGGYSRDFACQTCPCSPSTYFDPALNDGVAGGPNGRI